MKLVIKLSIITIFVLIISTIGFFKLSNVLAEKVGDSPESGATSRIVALYNELTALGFGSDTDAPDWGTIWNRIKTAAKWQPSGNVSEEDVRDGKTFYSDDRTQQTGNYPAPTNCSTQAWHDNAALANPTDNCSITWEAVNDGVTGTDKKDPRTGLIWSYPLLNNSGTPVFSSSSLSSWDWDGTTDADNIAVGNKTAIQLCSERGNGWRLPTQKELMQAYIDGSYFNLTLPNYYFWSATEFSATNAWVTSLIHGATTSSTKSSSNFVRCVR